ncbi:hypothetical protein MRB53_026721 [Persea americana]|uniref:Uncharacterized protein n=1 Tax=Persea americana TaxID=3435 RepID=A0ACC2LJ65_PERAE|nr:hypothetical protein MRB53_026721 [Persea americana]
MIDFALDDPLVESLDFRFQRSHGFNGARVSHYEFTMVVSDDASYACAVIVPGFIAPSKLSLQKPFASGNHLL